jgi:hypothetical protein
MRLQDVELSPCPFCGSIPRTRDQSSIAVHALTNVVNRHGGLEPGVRLRTIGEFHSLSVRCAKCDIEMREQVGGIKSPTVAAVQQGRERVIKKWNSRVDAPACFPDLPKPINDNYMSRIEDSAEVYQEMQSIAKEYAERDRRLRN